MPSSAPTPKPPSEPPSKPTPSMSNAQTTPTLTPPNPTINSISINQDSSTFAAATSTGFNIYSLSPLRLLRRNSSSSSGLYLVQLRFRSKILALVGGGPVPKYSPNKVMVWDDDISACVSEISFRSAVKSVRLRQDRIVAVLVPKILIYNFADLKILAQIETVDNHKGLCEVSGGASPFVMVCPGSQRGQIRVENFSASRRTRIISAHDAEVNCLGLTMDGRFVASASSKGTLIRVFNALDGTLLREVRRGIDKAKIQSLAFSSNAQWLASLSDKGTIHVFSLKLDTGSSGNNGLLILPDPPSSLRSPVSSISILKGVLPKYFSSEWSLAQFHLKEGTQCMVAFTHEESTVVIIGMDGRYYRCKFDSVFGGEMTQLEYRNFLKLEESSES